MSYLYAIPALYGLQLLLRLATSQGQVPRNLFWAAPITQLVVWGMYLSSFKQPAVEIASVMTMSWGLFSLVVVLGPLLLDRKDRYPELLDAGLLVAGMLSFLWLASIDAKLAVPASQWELASTWLFDLSGGAWLLLGMLSWRIYLDGTGEEGELLKWYNGLQTGVLIVTMGGVLCSFQRVLRISLIQQGHLLFLLLALGALLLPTIETKTLTTSRATNQASSAYVFSRIHRNWSAAGALFTLSWALMRLFVLV